jgi:hypothetical protein
MVLSAQKSTYLCAEPFLLWKQGEIEIVDPGRTLTEGTRPRSTAQVLPGGRGTGVERNWA